MQQKSWFLSAKYSATQKIRALAMFVFRASIYIGISYVILAPLISLVSRSIMPMEDVYSPLVYIVPRQVTLEHFKTAIKYMDYQGALLKTLPYCLGLTLLQLLISSSVGYGFARYKLPLGKVMFALVVLTIIIPSQTMLVPMYLQFRYFDPLGMSTLLTGGPQNLINTQLPMLLLTAFGMGLNTGLYIYIFRQFLYHCSLFTAARESNSRVRPASDGSASGSAV